MRYLRHGGNLQGTYGALVAPEAFGYLVIVVYCSREDKEIVAQAVDVFHNLSINIYQSGKGDDTSLGSSGYRACHIGAGGIGVTSGKDKLVVAGQSAFELVDSIFERLGGFGGECRGLPLRCGLGCQGRTDIE